MPVGKKDKRRARIELKVKKNSCIIKVDLYRFWSCVTETMKPNNLIYFPLKKFFFLQTFTTNAL